MQLQLEPLYIRNDDNDEMFYMAIVCWANFLAMRVPVPLMPVVGCLLSKNWVEASKN